MNMCRGDIQSKGKCHFVGYATEVNSVADVNAAYTKTRCMHPSARHIACGYWIPGVDFVTLRGYKDDDEHGAGRTIYQVLEDGKHFNKAVFVVRHYGNKHLGPIRFQLITAAAKTALEKFKWQSDKLFESQQGQHSGPGGRNLSSAPCVQHTDSGRTIIQNTVQQSNATTRQQNYVNVTSPRPFPAQQNWGSRESLSAISLEGVSFRQRSRSLDSTASGSSFTSAP